MGPFSFCWINYVWEDTHGAKFGQDNSDEASIQVNAMHLILCVGHDLAYKLGWLGRRCVTVARARDTACNCVYVRLAPLSYGYSISNTRSWDFILAAHPAKTTRLLLKICTLNDAFLDSECQTSSQVKAFKNFQTVRHTWNVSLNHHYQTVIRYLKTLRQVTLTDTQATKEPHITSKQYKIWSRPALNSDGK